MRDIEITTENPEFNPIRVEFVIESQEELEELWMRFNISNPALMGDKGVSFIKKLNRQVKPAGSSAFYPIWKRLDAILVKSESK